MGAVETTRWAPGLSRTWSPTTSWGTPRAVPEARAASVETRVAAVVRRRGCTVARGRATRRTSSLPGHDRTSEASIARRLRRRQLGVGLLRARAGARLRPPRARPPSAPRSVGRRERPPPPRRQGRWVRAARLARSRRRTDGRGQGRGSDALDTRGRGGAVEAWDAARRADRPTRRRGQAVGRPGTRARRREAAAIVVARAQTGGEVGSARRRYPAKSTIIRVSRGWCPPQPTGADGRGAGRRPRRPGPGPTRRSRRVEPDRLGELRRWVPTGPEGRRRTVSGRAYGEWAAVTNSTDAFARQGGGITNLADRGRGDRQVGQVGQGRRPEPRRRPRWSVSSPW